MELCSVMADGARYLGFCKKPGQLRDTDPPRLNAREQPRAERCGPGATQVMLAIAWVVVFAVLISQGVDRHKQ